VVFALGRKINNHKYAKTINLVCAGNIVFVEYQAQGRVNPTHPPLLRMPWGIAGCRKFYLFKNKPHNVN